MSLHCYAFIVKGSGYLALEHEAQLNSVEFSTRVVGVSDIEAALVAARRLVTAGVQLIELCGGFTRDEALRLQTEVGVDVPVGMVSYSEAQEEVLARLFGA